MMTRGEAQLEEGRRAREHAITLLRLADEQIDRARSLIARERAGTSPADPKPGP